MQGSCRSELPDRGDFEADRSKATPRRRPRARVNGLPPGGPDQSRAVPPRRRDAKTPICTGCLLPATNGRVLTFELSGRPAVGAPLERRIGSRLSRGPARYARGMFCATRHNTPLGSKSVKSRIAQGWSAGFPTSIPKRCATPDDKTWECQSSTFSTSRCI